MSPSLDQIKQQILRCYRKLDPRELEGLKKVKGIYYTADGKWSYFLRHGGFIEREHNFLTSKPGEETLP